MGLTPYTIAKACGVPRTRIERIAREELGISADTALRLGRFFGIEPEFWLNLETRHDLETTSAALGRGPARSPGPSRRRARSCRRSPREPDGASGRPCARPPTDRHCARTWRDRRA